MIRNILGVIAGIVAGFAAIILAQAIVNLIYPLPAGSDPFNREQMTEVFRGLPAGHFALILLTYLLGGFVGGAVTRLIAPAAGALWVAPVLIMLAAAVNVLSYPHPVWAQIGGIAAPLLGGWLASRAVRPRAVPVAATEDAEV